MRSGLRALQQAGRRRVRFSATFGCVDYRASSHGLTSSARLAYMMYWAEGDIE
jgi:hypothetical protein